MPAGRRFRIATASSLGFHALVIIVIGLLFSRAPVAAELLIPIELVMAEGLAPSATPGGAGQPEAPLRVEAAPATAKNPVKARPSSAGGTKKQAPAPPRILTAKSGDEAAGATGRGAEPAGPGGESDTPAGPSYGPGLVEGPLPIYPKNAVDRGLEGTVTLAAAISEDGSLKSVTVQKSSGHQLLDEAALRAVKEGWVFSPGKTAGKPASGQMTIIFEFSSGTVKRSQ